VLFIVIVDRLDRFRWVYCQLDTLSRCLPQSILKALNELPITLDDTYDLALQRIAREKKEHAHRLFQCLVAAVRPLRVDELAEIFAVDFNPDSEPNLVEGWRPEDPEEAVLSACSTLITIVGDDDSKIVQFSHFSVKEFLTSDRFRASQLENSTTIPLYISLDDAHTILTRACLTVLLQLDEKLNKELLKTFPLAFYAARHWVDHAKYENVASRSQDPMERLFNPKKPHLVAWTRIHNIDKGNEPSANDLDDGEERPLPARASSLYYAVLCGFAGIAEYLITIHGQDVNAKCGHHGTPLHAAAHEGHLEAARLLVKRKADVKMINSSNRTALCSAYDGSHLDVMQMLLESGADVEEKYAYSARLLHIASHHGQADVVELLIRNGANVDVRDSVSQTPLHEASTNGHLKVVEILLDKGANVNAETNGQSTPLHGASEGGHVEVVRTLLERGADVRMRNRKNRSALEVATTREHTDVMELLKNAEKGLEDTANMGVTSRPTVVQVP
jgi:ankyrin repeat protein